MWPFRFDVSRLSYPEVVRVLLPFFPGAVLVCGVTLAKFGPMSRLLASSVLGYHFKLFVVVSLTYVAGLVVVNLSDLFHSLLALAIGFRTRSRLGWASFEQLSRNVLWRKAAKKFLGDDFAPRILEPYTDAARAEALRQTESIQDPAEKINRSIALMGEAMGRVQVDSEWADIYRMLRPSFVKPEAQFLIGLYLASALGSMGWAGIVALAYARLTLWPLWLVAVICVVVGLFGAYTTQVLTGWLEIDFYAAQFTANLIREVKKAEAQHSASQISPEARDSHPA
jgi:hypothetical protein